MCKDFYLDHINNSQSNKTINNKKINTIKTWPRIWEDTTKDAIQMIYENLKRCTISLVIRKIQIKTRMRYYYKGITITMTTTTNRKKTHIWQYHEPVNVNSNWNFHTLMVGMYSHSEKISWLCLTKYFDYALLYDLAVLLPIVSQDEFKNYLHAKTCAQMFGAALWIITKNWKEPWCVIQVNILMVPP